MSIFPTNHRVDSAFRYVSEVAQTPVPETLVEDARRRVWQRLHASIAEGVENRDWDMNMAGFSGDGAADHQVDGGYETGAWWQRSIALPLPVVAAAAALFLVMTIGLILNPGVLSNDRTVADLQSDAPVNVQVQVNGNESDMLMRWLEEQNHVGNVTIQLPETAEFQLRGEPVLMRPKSLPEETDNEFEIVPMETSAE